MQRTSWLAVALCFASWAPAYAQPVPNPPPSAAAPPAAPPGNASSPSPAVAVPANLAPAAPAALAPAVQGCSADRDCKGDRICVANRCTAPDAGDGTGAFAVRDAPVKDASVGLYVNSLGVLQFGLSPTIELGKRFVVNAKAVVFNTGAASYALVGDDTLHFSYGIGPGFRYYFGEAGNVRGLYVGAEALYIAWEQEHQQSTVLQTQLVAPLVEVGYRWVRASGFSIGVGATLGGAFVIDRTARAVAGEMPSSNDAADRAIGFLHLDLGIVL